MSDKTDNVLFLCMGNFARPMAGRVRNAEPCATVGAGKPRYKGTA